MTHESSLFSVIMFALLLIAQSNAQYISTLAGGPTSPVHYYGDGGQATLAEFYRPKGISVDTVNNLVYIADNGNNKVRVVNRTSGIISLFAGSNLSGGYSGDTGLATNATLKGPSDVAINSINNLGKTTLSFVTLF
jgi:DNA-binding beta-propeller fold protein YncE